MSFVLANAQIIDIRSAFNGQQVDVLIEDGRIAEIGLQLKGDDVYDLEGKPLSPGFFDLFAQFGEPGNEHKEDIDSGILSARHAGFTDVCLIPNTDPVIETKGDVKFLLSRSGEGVSLHALAAASEGCKGENLTEIIDLHTAGAVAFTDGLNPIWNAELLLKVLQYLQKFDGMLITRPKDVHLAQHAQMHEGLVSTTLGMNGEPSVSEEISIKRDLDILRYAGGKIHFTHLSTAGGVALIQAAKAEGLAVTCDVALAQLLYTDQDLVGYDANFKVDPPLRTEEDRLVLLEGIRSGVIDAIVSSHQPHDPECKELEFDLASFGMNAYSSFVSDLLVLTKDLSLELIIDKLTHGPRSVLGLPEISITEGSEARFTLLDPEVKWTLKRGSNPSKSQNSPRFNQELKGKSLGVYQSGLYLNN
ncbi:dihydroorotase [Marinoscillum furvescens]|uniref:Dihydroorotase n=1 Tax=Marinoscillum furvescens DSM 4134 TaxID=1122208 RepID=A0A3D9KXM3_MARFU|nr:dihydroorotase [Marinoscillum furvescens]RED91763.1 dihydroorotase [Marinoscillum furvescens DSM 4134]